MSVAQAPYGNDTADVLPEIRTAKTSRDKKRLDLIMKIRLDNPELRVLDAPWKKALLYILFEARNNPASPFADAVRELRYSRRDFAERAGMMSPDTVLRDSRELEILGFFEKAEPSHPQAKSAAVHPTLL